MKKPTMLSAKKVALDKTYKSLLIIVSLSVFFTIFSAVAIKNLYSQMRYQSRVIAKKEKTLKQTEDNIKQEEKLVLAYQEFAGTGENIIGGNPSGNGDRDGENARIVLDALPSKYDFPALASGLDKLAKLGGFKLTSISGTDDEINQSANQGSASPQPVEIPFNIEADMTSADGKRFMQLFERSIRPVQVDKMEIASRDSGLKISLTAKTYFQPEKKLNVTEEVVK